MNRAAFYHIVRADFLERARSRSFFVLLALTVYLSYLFVPPLDANYATVALGDYRLRYNSAGIGLMFGIMLSMFVSLFAFYLIKNNIARDRRSHVGQIIAASPTPTPVYLLGKWGGNLLLLAVIVAVMTAMAPLLQWLRGEVTAIEPLALIAPIWLIGLPLLSLVAGLAVLFESIPLLRGGLGNVAYFFLWAIALTGIGVLVFDAGRDLPEPYGVATPLNAVFAQIRTARPGYGFELSLISEGMPPEVFDYQGAGWTAATVAARLFWLLAGGGLALGGLLFFDRFRPVPGKKKGPGRLRRFRPAWLAQWRRQRLAPAGAGLTPLTRRGGFFRPLPVLWAELRLLLNGQPWYLLAALAGAFIYGLAAPGDRTTPLYLLIMPVLIWSALGARARQERLLPLIYATPQAWRRQPPLAWLAGVLVAAFVLGGFGLRLVLTGAAPALLGLLAAALFVPALALALGTVSGTRRLFEIVYLCWWYLAINAPDTPLAWVDFTQAAPAPFYLLATAALLAVTLVWARRRPALG